MIIDIIECCRKNPSSFQIVERIVENGMIKVKRKIVKKKKAEPENVKVETSTTSSTSSVFGKFLN